ncbi:MAG: heme-dependent oxidative N-demethylase family protein [Candidatus Puniceispirillaceae bacterium]
MTAPWQKLGFKLKLGLRPRAESQWLPHIDLFGDEAERAAQMNKKAHLFACKHAEVFAALPAARAASAELLKLVTNHICKYHPSPPLPFDPAQHPLEVAASLVPEDMLLLAPRGAADSRNPERILWHLEAAALAFPAHWVLAEKMDQPLQTIHQPVPHYDERLATPVDRFFTAMQIGPISSRLNWSLQIGDQLFTPQRTARQPSTADKDLGTLFLRMENQTLRKLPQSGYVVFTIRTHLLPMKKWQDDRDALQSMLDMMHQMSPATQRYKGVELYAPIICNALRRLGQAI